MPETIRWGILGTGNIARKFAQGLKDTPDAELTAVGSRSAEKARAFADEFGGARAHGSYEALAGDDAVDAVYVATPHVLHYDNSVLCLRAGKAVLCEKPLTINAAQARALAEVARAEGRFLMEAMWTRFLPTLVETRRLLAEGAIGEVRMVMADFAFRTAFNPEHRLLNPALGGGGLLDVGVYTVAMAHMVFGVPSQISGLAELGSTGVDEQAAMVLGFPGGGLALLACGVRTNTPQDARILGTDGSIYLPAFWHGRKIVLSRNGKSEEIEPPFVGNGYNYEAIEVGRCLREGLTESPVMTLDESIAIMDTLDALRAQWGLRYPGE